jgi:hypothetical protein
MQRSALDKILKLYKINFIHIELNRQDEKMEPDEMLEFVKALSHADRLRVLGVLAQKTASANEISADLGMPLRAVHQHLAMLEHGGIVLQQAGSWTLDIKNVENLSRRQFEGKPREAYTPSPDLSDRPRKVLAAYLNADGTIKQLPHEPGKLQVILDYLLQAFTPGVIYTEKEVNMIIRRFHLDTAGLRRDMIDRGMLQRKSDGSQYWRPV